MRMKELEEGLVAVRNEGQRLEAERDNLLRQIRAYQASIASLQSQIQFGADCMSGLLTHMQEMEAEYEYLSRNRQ